MILYHRHSPAEIDAYRARGGPVLSSSYPEDRAAADGAAFAGLRRADLAASSAVRATTTDEGSAPPALSSPLGGTC